MSKSYRILSIEACDIYRHEQQNGNGVGFMLPKKGSDDYFAKFKNKLDYSLDAIELKRVYEDICGERFSFVDGNDNEYTCAVINVKFNYMFKPQSGASINVKKLREIYYKNGFCVDGVRYVRYKRSAGSSRQGKCLFIQERLYDVMAKWSECGLTAVSNLASWEAYKSLSLSSIKGIVNIPIEGILFVPDKQDKFYDEVVSVELSDGKLAAEQKNTTITNDIWDGESLLDESLFAGNYADKHMLLLRNKYFKSCAFRTKLQKWIKDKSITLEDLKKRKCVTLATDINQIVMVTTPNSLKYLKFVEFTEENIRRWAQNVDGNFGVVKWDKRTKFFGGRMVRSSYQLLNTVGLTEETANKLMQPSVDYLTTIRQDIDFMRYHFSDVCVKESSDDDDEIDKPDGLAQRADVVFKLMNINSDFQKTELYKGFRNDMVKNQKSKLCEGHILLSGTNATLFGNGPELLKFIAGEEKPHSALKFGQIRCGKFANGQKLVCARSPHITMGNLYCVENNLDGDIWNYFDLGENIVCVNAIGENIQQRLNGCDYDSDTMLVTDEELLVKIAEKYNRLFKVPVCNVKPSGTASFTLAELDYKTSENKIGEIVNLSQKLNSIIWDRLNSGNDEIADVYFDVCKLAVLSGLEIDKAKKAYDNVSVGKELEIIRCKYYNRSNPQFFKIIHEQAKKEYGFYNTAMEHVYKIASSIDFRKGKKKKATYIPVSSLLNVEQVNSKAIDKTAKHIRISSLLNVEQENSESDCKAIDKIIEICNRYMEIINNRYKEMRSVDIDECSVIYDDIREVKNKRDREIDALITNGNILYSVIKHYEEGKIKDWHLYAPVLNSDMFCRILKQSKEKLAAIVEEHCGEYPLYGFRYSKK